MTLPRVALGTIGDEADPRPVAWGLLDLLERSGLQVQSFASRACFSPWDAAKTITGQSARHLDSWMMPPGLCRASFLRGAVASDFSLIEGPFDSPGDADSAVDDHAPALGGSLDKLCGWLNLPRLAVVDVRSFGPCRLPERPTADGLILQSVADSGDLHRWQTSLEAIWGIPVLGGAIYSAALQAEIELLPVGEAPSRQLCHALGNRLAGGLSVGVVRRIAERYEFPGEILQARLPTIGRVGTETSVAMAYDDAFHCYFPDTLDLMETLGVNLVDFSPLRDEGLPPGTDVVYLGCGQPQRFAATLSQNQCMLLALRKHLCAGKRIYAEGGGLAYLCQHLQTAELGKLPMVGAIPAVAVLNPVATAPRPLEITLARHTWLGNAGLHLRGYLNTAWHFEPTGELNGLVAEPGHERDLLVRHQAIGSRLHLNFGAQPDFLRCFSQPHPEALAWSAR